MPKFQVEKASEDGLVPSRQTSHADDDLPVIQVPGNDAGGQASMEEVALAMDESIENQNEAHKNLYLFEEDMKQMPRVATFLKNILSYHTTHPTEKDTERAKKTTKKAKLGVILGVYLPTIQHIFGVLMFVRLAWIVGSMGTLQAFVMVFVCCLTTFVTAISMSAIATNGMVQAGGSYFMISRNLGPECGGAIGICFYLANTFAVDLYILGAIEILLQYMAPGLSFFGDIHHNPWNNFRVYGTIVLLLLSFVVAVGVKFVQIFAPFSLSCVIVSIICIFIGAFTANEDTRNIWICLVGDRLMTLPDNITDSSDGSWCNKNESGTLWNRYCHQDNGTYTCDPYFESEDVSYIPGIPGLFSGIISSNVWDQYMKKGEVVPGIQGDHHKGEVTQDITTSFVMLCAIYFPSVTGIMTGSNMSGDLRDPQKSIPIGTILANLTCSFVYLSFVILFGGSAEGALLRDKFGESIGGKLLAAVLAWPSHWVILIGGFCSTIGAALQCLTSAPRLLQAIARDDIIPFLSVFKSTTKHGEPIRALVITVLIAEIGIIIASLDYVAHVIDVFFLMCYGFVNLTCALQTLLNSPSWRPRFKYYHWSLSVLGVILNLALSIIAGWYYALSAFLIAAFIYKYVEYKGGEKEWGDGIEGLSMSAAQKALLKLEEGDPHTKNWRPQVLMLCKLNSELQPKYRSMFSLVNQLKAGRGLTVSAAVLKGNYMDLNDEAAQAKENMKAVMKEEKVKGFSKVMVTKDVTEGINIFVQTMGLGGLKPNAVMVGWPESWSESHEEHNWKVFLDTVRAVNAKDLALLVPRGIQRFPHNKERLTGTVDVWWIVHDGGMLILLSFLMTQHKVWKQCKLRIFTVAQMTDNSIQLKKDLETFLYQLRIQAEVHVEEMYDSDISAYTVERTLDMEKRAQMLREMKLTRKAIQEIVDSSHNPMGPRRQSSVSGRHNEADKKDMDLLQVPEDPEERMVQFTFTACDTKARLLPAGTAESSEAQENLISEGKLMRMHTAIKLNAAIKEQSGNAALVIINFPAPPAKLSAGENYMEYLEALSEGLERVLMVRGSGKEVVTMYS